MSEKNINTGESQFTYYFVGPLNLDRKAKRAVTVQGVELQLSADEFAALDILASQEDEPLTFELLYSAVWNAGENLCEREAARVKLENVSRRVKEAGDGFMWIEYEPEKGYTFKTHWGHNWQDQKYITTGEFCFRCEECDEAWPGTHEPFAKSSISSEHLNRCPICMRMVCNACFFICDSSDMCRPCAERLGESGMPVLPDDSGDSQDNTDRMESGAITLRLKKSVHKGQSAKSNKTITRAAAACVIFIIVGAGVFLATGANTGLTDIGGDQLPMAEYPLPGEDGCIIPDFDILTIPADTRTVFMPLSNIDGNFFCKTFEIRLSDTDETLYVSGLIEPGMNEHIITLNRPLEAGEYKAALIIKMFTPEEQNFAGETTMDFDLIAEKGEVM